MEIKLKSGRKLKLKDVSIDERDEMLDAIEYEWDADGNPLKVKKMNSTITKWLRLGLEGDVSDEFIKKLTFDERVEAFTLMQSEIIMGEETPSDSK